MVLGYGVWMFLLGVLGAANLIIAKKPDAKALIDKLAPYQGWMGACAALSGVWGIIQSVMWLSYLGSNPIGWVTYLATSLLLFSLGLLLGVGVLKQFIKQPQAVEKMDQLIVKLAPKQGVLGLVAIGMGVWCVVSSFLFAF